MGILKKMLQLKKIIKHKHNKLKYTLFSAINAQCVVAYKVFDKLVNGEIYKKFIDDNKNLFICL